jgi:hypothetical protein
VSHIHPERTGAIANRLTPTKEAGHFFEIVENKFLELPNRDIKPLQIVVLSRF